MSSTFRPVKAVSRKLVPSLTESKNRCLVFHIAGPMSSWGTVAVGTMRPTQRHPTKSAIIGIVAASLGLTRDDPRIATLFSDFEYAVISSGIESEMSDYATVQTSSAISGEFKSDLPPRSLELSRSKLEAMLVDKRYVCNGFYTVLMVPSGKTEFGLEVIMDALQHPYFLPYLGRKSCPLSFPMCPTIEEYSHIRDIIPSIYLRPFRHDAFPESRLLKDLRNLRIFSTYPMDGYGGHTEYVVLDDDLDRKSWQFRERVEFEFMEGLE